MVFKTFGASLKVQQTRTSAFTVPEEAKLFPEENRERQFKMLQLAQRAFLDSGEDDSFNKRMPNVKGHKGVRFEQYEAFNRAMQNTIAMTDPPGLAGNFLCYFTEIEESSGGG